jgi:transcriptional regulator with XRE-family HTH domain
MFPSWRERSGLSRKAFAKKIGKTPSFVSVLESGQRKPSVVTLCLAVKALKLSPDETVAALNFVAGDPQVPADPPTAASPKKRAA